MMDTGTSAITTIHLTIIIVLAIAAVAAIVWGMRLKRARVAAAKQFAVNQQESIDATQREQAELGEDPLHTAPPPQTQTQTQTQTQGSSRAVPIPVAPAPPPVADEAAPGTPPETGGLADEPPQIGDVVDEPQIGYLADEPQIGHVADEPIAAAAPMAASVASEAAPDRAATADAAPQDRPVTLLKGLGPKVATALADRGITTVGQIAALDAGQADALDAGLGAFSGRMARDRWVEQARFLASGDDKGFEQVFGRL